MINPRSKKCAAFVIRRHGAIPMYSGKEGVMYFYPNVKVGNHTLLDYLKCADTPIKFKVSD
jgi:hypothetical protein